MMSAAMMTMATALTPSPPPQPKANLKTVEVASTAMTVSKVSQPTQSSHEMNDGEAIASNAVGGATEDHRRCRTSLPGGRDDAAQHETDDDADDPTISPCQKEMPNPR
jgi:hypothetical protein